MSNEIKLITDNAKVIAEIIHETNIDYRGNLLNEVGEILKTKGQGYTGSLMMFSGKQYGINSKAPTGEER